MYCCVSVFVCKFNGNHIFTPKEDKYLENVIYTSLPWNVARIWHVYLLCFLRFAKTESYCFFLVFYPQMFFASLWPIFLAGAKSHLIMTCLIVCTNKTKCDKTTLELSLWILNYEEWQHLCLVKPVVGNWANCFFLSK